MELKPWETLNLLKLDIEKAIAEHDAALGKLRRNGSPIYSPEIMREHEATARQKLTVALDRCNERAAAFRARAEATAAAGRDDPYSWLSDAELQRAALLRPFIAEDVAATGAEELTRYAMQVTTGRRKLDRPTAWLLMREAERLDNMPIEPFERAAMPPEIAAAEEEAHTARTLQDRINGARPEYQEHIHRDILGKANWNATGQPIGQ